MLVELTTQERQAILERVAAIMPIHETIEKKALADLNLDNDERSERAACSLLCYPGGDPEDLAATIVDLVTDLLHLAHKNDIEPDYVTQTAQEHYDAEVREEAGLE
jgi:hypothetical protein